MSRGTFPARVSHVTADHLLPCVAWLPPPAAQSPPSLSAAATADTLHGRVVAVTDGDTIKILAADNHQGRIRLADRAKARQVEVSNHVTVNISVDNYLPI